MGKLKASDFDEIMEKLWNYLQEKSFELVISVEREEYERSQELKDQIDSAIEKIADLLIEKEAVTIPKEDAIETLNGLLSTNMNEWYNALEIPEERRAK